MVYNSSFYYHQRDSPTIIRYDLEKRETICKPIILLIQTKQTNSIDLQFHVILFLFFIGFDFHFHSCKILLKYFRLDFMFCLQTHTHTQTHTGNITLPDFQWNGDHYLYTTKCNYVDLNADENGLWAIYSTPKTTNTYVVKVK